ncbi:MAG: VOC family protein [Phycisphaerales bacterium JB052]
MIANIRGIAEIVLNAQDIGLLSAFYQRVLGFALHAQHPKSEPTIVFLRVGASHTALNRSHPQLLALIDPDRHPAARGKFDPPTRRAFPLNHLAFEIEEDEYNAHLEHLRCEGLEPSEARFEHAQAKAMFFQDPEGNRLELICRDSGVSTEQALEAERALDASIERSLN